MEQTIISIISPSGGSGKSTIAKELAIAYAERSLNKKLINVCIFDAGVGSGAQMSLFHLSPKYYVEDWIYDIHANLKYRDAADIISGYRWDDIEKYLSFSSDHNLYILPSDVSFFDDDYQNICLDKESFYLIILALKRFFDVIIIDTSRQLDSALLSSMVFADEVLLLLTDDRRSLVNVAKIKQLIRDHKIPAAKFFPVMNMFSEKSRERFFDPDEITEITIAHFLSYDRTVWTLNNMNDAVVLQSHDSKLKTQLLQLAVHLLPEYADNIIL